MTSSKEPSFFNTVQTVITTFSGIPHMLPASNPAHQSLTKQGLSHIQFITSEFESFSQAGALNLGQAVSDTLNIGLKRAGYDQAIVTPVIWNNLKGGAMVMLAYGSLDGTSPPIFPTQQLKQHTKNIQKELFGEENDKGLMPAKWEFVPVNVGSNLEAAYMWKAETETENTLARLARRIIDSRGGKTSKQHKTEDGNELIVAPKEDFERILANERLVQGPSRDPR